MATSAVALDSQIQNSRDALIKKQLDENGEFWGQILHIAAIVTGVWTAVMFGGFGGVLLGLVSYLALTKLFVLSYDRLRNWDY